ncbi:MAG: hypothetical protein R3C05_30080 [Pirellulaceae bacterium]
MLDDAAALVTAITDPLQPTPQTGLVLQLLARDLPMETLGSIDATRVARFLELNLRNDHFTGEDCTFAMQTYRWINDWIAEADRNRRFAGDLLMGKPRRVDAGRLLGCSGSPVRTKRTDTLL